MLRRKVNRASLRFSVLCLAGVLAALPAYAEELPKLGIASAETSVSGLSSGAYMAGQIEVAHSKDIVGAGIVAGGPFACAETESSQLFPYWPVVMWQNATQATNACMKVDWGAPDADKLAKRAKELAEDGKIDDLAGLADDKVYLFSGNEDQTVERRVVEAARHFLEEVGVPETNINLVEKQGGHAFITEQGGATCGITAKPYVSNCNYGQAKAILAWIYGPLQDTPRSPIRTGSSSSSPDQSERDQPSRLLGLVGLYRPRLSRQGCSPDTAIWAMVEQLAKSP